jgi:hypothetical protein
LLCSANLCPAVSESERARLSALQSAHAALEVRFQAALQVIGERDEENEDLHTEMNHVKSVFRAQIEQLLALIDNLKKQDRKHNAESGGSNGSAAAAARAVPGTPAPNPAAAAP